jgi:hypothetical protein
MKIFPLVLVALISASPARAATVVWFDSGNVTSVSFFGGFPGLTIGTPWSMQFSFDPNAPRTPLGGPSPAAGCGFSSIDSSVFTLGGFTYTSSGGRVYTNSFLPHTSCDEPPPTGMIQFEWSTSWTVEPDAWNINGFGGYLIAGYRDAIFRDGPLPTSPSLTGFDTGFSFFQLTDEARILFQDRTFAPVALEASPVPEPGTVALLGAGLAWLGRRRYRDAKRAR